MVGQTIALFDLGTLQTAETAPKERAGQRYIRIYLAPIMHGFSLFWLSCQAECFHYPTFKPIRILIDNDSFSNL